jgi:hypothetical protein
MVPTDDDIALMTFTQAVDAMAAAYAREEHEPAENIAEGERIAQAWIRTHDRKESHEYDHHPVHQSRPNLR